MGGNALKSLSVTRIGMTDYQERLLKFIQYAHEYVHELNNDDFLFGFTMPLKGKTDFGDLDVIYTCKPENVEKTIRFFEEKFNSRGKVKTGKCTSVEWDYFQVDMIYQSSVEDFKWAVEWYSHSDHSAILGRVYKFYGFLLKDNGLYYKINTADLKREWLVTQDWQKANQLLGYSPTTSTFMYTEEEGIDHIFSSPYCNKTLFVTNSMDRHRPMQIKCFERAATDPNLKEYEGKNRKFDGWKIILAFDSGLAYKIAWTYFWLKLERNWLPFKRIYRKYRYKLFEPKRKDKKNGTTK